MSEMSKIQGTPWHVGRYTRPEGDERRHRSNCVYFRKKDKFCTKCYVGCIGSAHCDYYESKKEAAEESILQTCTKLRNTEALKKHEMANRFAFVEGMRVYRKSNGAFGNVVRVYKNQGVKYVDIDFGGKVVSFNYEKTVAADGFMAVKNK